MNCAGSINQRQRQLRRISAALLMCCVPFWGSLVLLVHTGLWQVGWQMGTGTSAQQTALICLAVDVRRVWMIPFTCQPSLHVSSLILMTQSCTHGAWVNSRPCHVTASGVIICLQARVSLCCDAVTSWAGSEHGQAATKATVVPLSRSCVLCCTDAGALLAWVQAVGAWTTR